MGGNSSKAYGENNDVGTMTCVKFSDSLSGESFVKEDSKRAKELESQKGVVVGGMGDELLVQTEKGELDRVKTSAEGVCEITEFSPQEQAIILMEYVQRNGIDRRVAGDLVRLSINFESQAKLEEKDDATMNAIRVHENRARGRIGICCDLVENGRYKLLQVVFIEDGYFCDILAPREMFDEVSYSEELLPCETARIVRDMICKLVEVDARKRKSTERLRKRVEEEEKNDEKKGCIENINERLASIEHTQNAILQLLLAKK